MKEIKQVVTKEQIGYELTKEELEAIQKTERDNGRDDVIGYLAFVIQNYRYEFNLAGVRNFLKELIEFLARKSNFIENTYGYSFIDYVKGYRQK